MRRIFNSLLGIIWKYGQARSLVFHVHMKHLKVSHFVLIFLGYVGQPQDTRISVGLQGVWWIGKKSFIVKIIEGYLQGWGGMYFVPPASSVGLVESWNCSCAVWDRMYLVVPVVWGRVDLLSPRGFGPVRVCSLLASYVSKLQILSLTTFRTILISDKKVSANKTVRRYPKYLQYSIKVLISSNSLAFLYVANSS